VGHQSMPRFGSPLKMGISLAAKISSAGLQKFMQPDFNFVFLW
jgi:hypothetical protein